ncbi:MAG: dihydroorotase, partial [Ferruginibacter sp.]
MEKKIIRNVQLVNEGKIVTTDVLIHGERIERIDPQINTPYAVQETDGSGKHLIPGMIDDQVH